MRNFVAPGANIDIASAPYECDSGDYVLVGLLGGVANGDADSNGAVVITTEGVFDIEADTTDTWAIGAAVYFSLADRLCHASAQGDSNSIESNSAGEDSDARIGIAVKAKGAGESTVRVLLQPVSAA